MSETITVRPAIAEDKAPLLAFCQDTFEWGDYIDRVWDDWLADENGRIVVGLIGNQPVAMLHVAIIESRTAWMEGMRVHPDYRLRGVATAADKAGREYARGRGCRVARLATSSKNGPAQKTLNFLGYGRVATFHTWSAPVLTDAEPEVRVATDRDVPLVLDHWSHSTVRQASYLLLPDPHWRWTELNESRLREQITQGQVRVSPSGFSIVPAFANDQDSELDIHAVVGDRETTCSLALAARQEAGYRGFSQIEALVADDLVCSSGLTDAGFERHESMLIYEYVL